MPISSPCFIKLQLTPSEAFRQGLREVGWVEGQNIMVEYRSAEGRSERLPDLAVELVRLKVDVIVRSPTAASVEAKKEVERRVGRRKPTS